jgi:hypothetical protein
MEREVMTRSKDFMPDVPSTYRGVEVCDHVAYRWGSYEGSMWRMGIDQALDAVLESLDDEMKYWNSSYWGWNDGYDSGLYDGKEQAADNTRDAVNTYKKES